MDPIRGPPTAGGVEAAAAPPPRNANGSTSTNDSAAGLGTGDGQGRRKRARDSRSIASPAAASAPPAASGPAAAAATASSHAPHVDALAHIDLVVYAGYEIRAQYPSPYPLEELPGTPAASTSTASGAAANNNNAATQMRENGGRFGGKKAAPNATSTASTTVPISENDNDGGKAPNGADGPTPPPSRGSTGFSTHGTETAAGREISPELAAPATAVAAPPPPVGAMPMQIDIASTPLDGGEFAAASMTPQLVAAPDSVAVAETPTPSPLETIPPPAPLPPPPSAAGTATASGAPPIASTSAALSYPTQPTPPVPTSRGSRGRFLPKPPGETVKAKRAAERAARLAAGKDASSPNAHGEGYLTQRQQRELARKAREERERELREKQKLLPPTEVKLFVCDRCFKYMALPAAYLTHQKECQVTKPPGRRVYQRGATSIWEVDGAQAKLYCQNLCLFAKLFIEHKYMFFDVESFTFYLLTEAMGKQEWVLGYFSKEKISYDDYNLACIVVFPPFRQRGWATLLIEFSYELSRRYSATPGTPERPLSELGQRGYLAYWISLLVRYFRAVFALRDRPPLIDKVISAPGRVSVSPAKNSQADDADDVDEADRLERERKKRLRRSKGWDGELPSGGNLLAKSPAKAFTLRPLPSVVEAHVASPNGGGGEGTSSVEVVDGEEVFSFATGLDELAHAVNLRPDDVAYALVESGLARWRSRGVAAATEQLQAENEVETNGVAVDVVGDGDIKMEEDGAEAKLQAVAVSSTATATPPPSVGGRPPLQEAATVDQELELIITPELVEEVARQKGVKPMPMLDVAYVCGL